MLSKTVMTHSLRSHQLLSIFIVTTVKDYSSEWCHHDKVCRNLLLNSHNVIFIGFNGEPYQSKHGFTCKAQADKFKDLLQQMASRPQDYVSLGGQMTTNAVEGFHGLALMY